MRRRTLPISVSGRIDIEISVGDAKPKHVNIFDAIYERVRKRRQR